MRSKALVTGLSRPFASFSRALMLALDRSSMASDMFTWSKVQLMTRREIDDKWCKLSTGERFDNMDEAEM